MSYRLLSFWKITFWHWDSFDRGKQARSLISALFVLHIIFFKYKKFKLCGIRPTFGFQPPWLLNQGVFRGVIFKWLLFSAQTFNNVRTFVRWDRRHTNVSWITRFGFNFYSKWFSVNSTRDTLHKFRFRFSTFLIETLEKIIFMGQKETR